jgi:hypothetical protein
VPSFFKTVLFKVVALGFSEAQGEDGQHHEKAYEEANETCVS